MKKILSIIFIMAALVVTSCNKKDVKSEKYSEDPNKDSLLALLTFDDDNDDLYVVKNEAKSGVSYSIANFRNDVTNNIFYKKPSPAYRHDSTVDGKALAFDGYSNYVEMGSVMGNASEFSVDLWATLRTYELDSANRNITPFIECYDRNEQTGFVFGFGRFGEIVLLFFADAGPRQINTGAKIGLTEWTHLSFSYVDGRVTIYKNGLSISEEVVAGVKLSGKEETFLGRNTFNQTAENIYPFNYLSGSLDEIRMYSKALSGSDILKLHNKYLKNGEMPSCKFTDINFPIDYLSDGVYRTLWHGLPHFAWVSDTNGGFFYKDNYHLFFTKSDLGPDLRSQTWGHIVSPDMVHWHEVSPAIRCEDNGYDNLYVFAGSAAVINDIPYIFYTGYTTYPNGGFSCTISMARPKDLNDPNLEEWVKMPEVKLRLPGGFKFDEFRDPQIYIEHDTAFLMVVSRRTNGNPVLLGFSAPVNNITNWTYRDVAFEVDYSRYKYSGYMWEVPSFLRLTNPSGTKVKYLFAQAPMNDVGLPNDSIYFLGDFNWQTCRYTVTDLNARRWDHGSDYFGCSGGEIYDPKLNQTIIFETLQCCWNLNDQHKFMSGYSAGWNMGRYYSLDDNGELVVNHIDYSSTYGETLLSINNSIASSLEDNYKIGRSYRLAYKMKLGDEKRRAGFSVLSSKTGTTSMVFNYEVNKQRFVLDEMRTTNPCSKCTNYLDVKIDPNKEVEIEIFVDQSCVEVYIDNKYCMSGRAYNTIYDDYIVPIGDNWTVSDLVVNEMKGVY